MSLNIQHPAPPKPTFLKDAAAGTVFKFKVSNGVTSNPETDVFIVCRDINGGQSVMIRYVRLHTGEAFLSSTDGGGALTIIPLDATLTYKQP